MTLIEAVEAYLKHVCAGKTNATPSAYRSKLNQLIRFLGPDYLDLCQSDLDRFRVWLLERETKRIGGTEVKGRLSRFTIRSVLATTRHFLTWYCKQTKQSLELQNIKEPKPDPKAIDQVTVDKLLAAAAVHGEPWEQARNTAIIYVLRDTGGRVGAISRIDIDCMDLTAGYATAPDKNDQIAWLYFNPPTIAAIKTWLDYRADRNPADYRLFTGARGRGLSSQGIARMLSRLADAAGVTGRHNPHSFRHAFVRDAILAGADLGQASELAGHSSIVVTHKYYARWSKKELHQAHQKFSPGRNLPEPELGQGSAKP